MLAITHSHRIKSCSKMVGLALGGRDIRIIAKRAPREHTVDAHAKNRVVKVSKPDRSRNQNFGLFDDFEETGGQELQAGCSSPLLRLLSSQVGDA